jgi:hypothetical protein
MRKQQLTGRGPGSAVDGEDIVVARIPHRGYAEREFLHAGVIIAHVHVAIPEARYQRLSPTVNDLRADRQRQGVRASHGADESFVDNDRLVRDEA